MSTSPVRPGLHLNAPATGTYLGTGRSGPFTLRVFRPAPTRIVVLSGGFAAQLVAMRAATSGAAVRVLTTRPSGWAPLLQHSPDARLVPDLGSLRGRGPVMFVDDRMGAERPMVEVSDWQCLVDLRAIAVDSSVQGAPDGLLSFASADVVVLGVLSAAITAAAARVFDLDRADATTLAGGLPRQAVALVTRGRVELVRVDASATEAQVMRSAAL